MTNRIHFIDVQEHTRHGARYVLQYGADEMAEVFTEAERSALTSGEQVRKGVCTYADLQAFYDVRA
ncbi:hypothetical protein [Roseovarius mucosus]|uniref:hypothetical protein n=1 Tax=Roseovarius mucosus TaxID=215743 RepID=UPI003BA851DA